MANTDLMGWRRDDNGFVLNEPSINFTSGVDEGCVNVYSSTPLKLDGYFVLRVTKQWCMVRHDGQLEEIGRRVYDEFFLYHDGRGWEPIGVGYDGQIHAWFIRKP